MLNKSIDLPKNSYDEILEALDPEATGYIDIEDLVRFI